MTNNSSQHYHNSIISCQHSFLLHRNFDFLENWCNVWLSIVCNFVLSHCCCCENTYSVKKTNNKTNSNSDFSFSFLFFFGEKHQISKEVLNNACKACALRSCWLVLGLWEFFCFVDILEARPQFLFVTFKLYCITNRLCDQSSFVCCFGFVRNFSQKHGSLSSKKREKKKTECNKIKKMNITNKQKKKQSNQIPTLHRKQSDCWHEHIAMLWKTTLAKMNFDDSIESENCALAHPHPTLCHFLLKEFFLFFGFGTNVSLFLQPNQQIWGWSDKQKKQKKRNLVLVVAVLALTTAADSSPLEF